MKQNRLLPIGGAILVLFVLASCKGPQTPEQPIPSPGKPLDWGHEAQWIRAYAEPNDSLLRVRYEHSYTQHVAAQRWDSAANVLTAAGYNFGQTRMTPDTTWLRQAQTFLQAHDKRLSPYFRVSIRQLMGHHYMLLRQQSQALQWLREAQDLGRNSRDYFVLERVAAAYGAERDLLSIAGRIEEAESACLKAIAIQERLNDTVGLPISLIGLANLYQVVNAVNEADSILERASQLLIHNRNYKQLLGPYALRATIAAFRADTTGVIAFGTKFKYLQDSLQTLPARNRFFAHHLYGVALTYQGRLDSAAYHVAEAQRIAEQSGNPLLRSKYIAAKANLNAAQGTAYANMPELLGMIAELEATGDYLNLNALYDVVSNAYERHGNTAQALKYRKLAQSTRDKIWDDQKRGQLFELERRYRTEQKERQLLAQGLLLAQQRTTIVTLLLALIVLSVVAGLYYSISRQREARRQAALQASFIRQSIEYTEQEHARIARDLHDSVGQHLLVLRRQVSDNPQAQEQTDDIIKEVRHISRNLHPIALDVLGLERGLRVLCEQQSREHDLLVTGDIEYAGGLSKPQELHLFRIVQEALSNTVKYSKAEACSVTIQPRQQALYVRIEDSGQGFDVEAALRSERSFGIRNILYRGEILGAKLQLSSSSKGTCYTLVVPLLSTP